MFLVSERERERERESIILRVIFQVKSLYTIKSYKISNPQISPFVILKLWMRCNLGVIKGGSLKSASKKTDDAINGKMKILVTLGFGEDLKAFIYLF